jgi:hypothetical protein
MINKALLMAGLLAAAAVQADSRGHYYPERLEWLNIEQQVGQAQQRTSMIERDGAHWLQLDAGQARGFVRWHSGDYLRLQLSAADDAQSLQLWLSYGDGLFQQIQPVNQWHSAQQQHWLLHKSLARDAVLMLSKASGPQLTVALQQSRHRQAPGLLRSPTITAGPVSALMDQWSAAWFRYQKSYRADPQQPLQLQLTGPADYLLAWRTPWQSHYGLQDNMQMALSVGQQAPMMQSWSLNPDLGEAFHDPQQACGQSLESRWRFSVPEGEHQITVSPDRAIAGRVMPLADHERFLLAHNYPPGLSMLKQLSPPPAPESAPASVYRSLQPRQSSALRYYYPLSTSTGEASPLYFPAGRLPLSSSQPFQQLGGATQLEYALPVQAAPGLRVNLKLTEAEGQFELRSDQGEVKRFVYIPAARSGDLQLSAAATLARPQLQADQLAEMVVASQTLQFQQPFNTVSWHNTGSQALWLNLQYQDLSQARLTDTAFIQGSAQLTWQQWLDRLTPHTELSDRDLMAAEWPYWRKRLQSRQQDWQRLLPDSRIPLSNQRQQRLLTELGQIAGEPDLLWPELIQTLDNMGRNRDSERLLMVKAQGNQITSQQQAEEQLLARWQAEQRWWAIEAYWLERLLANEDRQARAGRYWPIADGAAPVCPGRQMVLAGEPLPDP